jgi:hypothetical protein
MNRKKKRDRGIEREREEEGKTERHFQRKAEVR